LLTIIFGFFGLVFFISNSETFGFLFILLLRLFIGVILPLIFIGVFIGIIR